MLTYRLRAETTAVVLHDSHTPPSQSDVQHFLAVGGRDRGLLDIGYHFLILRDGRLIECRPAAVQGTHMRSKRNRDTIGVCLVGGRTEDPEPYCVHGHDRCYEGAADACPYCESRRVPENNFTPAQWDTFRNLWWALQRQFGRLAVMGHSEIDQRHPGSCPPVDMVSVRTWLTSPKGGPECPTRSTALSSRS